MYHTNAVSRAPTLRNGSDTLRLNALATVGNRDHLSINVIVHDNTDVNPFRLLLNAVDALAIIGLQDIRGRLPASRFQLTKYPSVVIDVDPAAAATDVMNLAASLCVYHGVSDVLRRRIYKEVTIICEFRMGSVKEMLGVSLRTISPDPDKAMSVSASNGTESTMAVSDALRPHFFYVHDAEALDYTDTMVTLMYSIMHLSRQSKTAVMPRTYTDPGTHWDACIIFPGDGPRPPRGPPPYLEFRWVIGTLRKVPDFMIQQRRFAELGIHFRIDDVYLGSAILKKGKPDRAVALNGNFTRATI
ncbi:MAG: hypothetical protein L6R40_006829 [Gallowayella cf. fulva]|nr:MAG: hypothetical protein L6R40_006829 [Xanthomendoza cf. fulva]